MRVKQQNRRGKAAILAVSSLFVMSIWNPDFHWIPPAPIGGGGESGGAGASGDWEPEGCPVITTPWELILDQIKENAGTLYQDAIYTDAEHALYGLFYLDVEYSY